VNSASLGLASTKGQLIYRFRPTYFAKSRLFWALFLEMLMRPKNNNCDRIKKAMRPGTGSRWAKETTDWLPPIWCKWKSDRCTTHSIHSPHVWPLEHFHVHRPCGTGETPNMSNQQKKAAPKPNTQRRQSAFSSGQ
jgi:hypothetical protein